MKKKKFNPIAIPKFWMEKPKKTIEQYSKIGDVYIASYNDKVPITSLPNSATHVSVKYHWDSYSDSPEGVEMTFWIAKEVENKDYEKQLVNYENKLSEYKKQLDEWEKDKDQWEKEQEVENQSKRRKMYEKLKKEFEGKNSA